MKYDLVEVSQRGDEAFEALSEVEKDHYNLYGLEALSQREGFEHIVVSDRNPRIRRIIFLDRAE